MLFLHSFRLLRYLGQRLASKDKHGKPSNLNGKSAKKNRKDPKFARTQTLSNPIGSNCSTLSSTLIASRYASIPSVMNSIGIISKAAIWNLKWKNASAFAGRSMAKKGIMMVIYMEDTIDQIHCRKPAMKAFTTTLLANEPVWIGSAVSLSVLKAWASAWLTNWGGIYFSMNVPSSSSWPNKSKIKGESLNVTLTRSRSLAETDSGSLNFSWMLIFFSINSISSQL